MPDREYNREVDTNKSYENGKLVSEQVTVTKRFDNTEKRFTVRGFVRG